MDTIIRKQYRRMGKLLNIRSNSKEKRVSTKKEDVEFCSSTSSIG